MTSGGRYKDGTPYEPVKKDSSGLHFTTTRRICDRCQVTKQVVKGWKQKGPRWHCPECVQQDNERKAAASALAAGQVAPSEKVEVRDAATSELGCAK